MVFKKTAIMICLMVSASAGANDQNPNPAQEAVAGKSVLAMAVTKSELAIVATGYSAKKMILGKTVYNDKDKIGTVSDIIVTKDKSISYGIIDVGGFLGIGKKHVAIPVGLFNMENGKIILTDATRVTLESMPTFEYSR